MLDPLFGLPILLKLKGMIHFNGWAVYFAVKAYGFPRLYRRLVRVTTRNQILVQLF